MRRLFLRHSEYNCAKLSKEWSFDPPIAVRELAQTVFTVLNILSMLGHGSASTKVYLVPSRLALINLNELAAIIMGSS